MPDLIRHSNDKQRGWTYFKLVLEHAGIARSPGTDAALEELADLLQGNEGAVRLPTR